MFLLYFCLWVIFNGQLTLEIAIFGVIVAAAVFAFTCKFADYSIEKEKRLFKNFFRIIQYTIVLIIEIVKANLSVAHLILTEKEEPEPQLVTFSTDLKTSLGRSMLANSITLTPGTITVLLEDNNYTVHCLDKDFAYGLNDSAFVEILKKSEEA